MDNFSELLQETPDMDFSENVMEQETPENNFDEINAEETSDMNLSEMVLVHTANEELFAGDDSDIDDLDEPDQYVEGEDDVEDSHQETSNQNNSESARIEKIKVVSKSKDSSDNRLVHLPSARVKHIMKVDPDVTLITGECTFLVTKATELFIESLAREAFLHTAQSKKKTVQKRDVDTAIEQVESLLFLEGMMNF